MTTPVEQVEIQFPRKLRFLFDQHRYKVALSGRGAAKSWSFARALLLLGARGKKRILCARETQKSIADSVHRLLADQITEMRMGGVYEVQKAAIIGKTGTEFAFAGLKHNINNIKSLESFDIVWVEEAQAVSKNSWETLIPTVRKDGSEIWVSFNPELATDETYERFVTSPPPGAFVQRLTWRDNPWFPKILQDEKDHLKRTDPVAYDTIWEGMCRSAIEGGIYSEEIKRCEKENRIMRVPYDASKPVHTFWDLGWSDMVTIWFAQAIGMEYRLIDYYENSQQPLNHYIKTLQSKPYIYGTDWLPWDGRSKQLATGRSIMELMQAAGRKVQIAPRLEVFDGINAARTIFSQCFFDGEKCKDGLQALRHYRWGAASQTGTTRKEPLHDWASHASDAFRAFAVGIRQPKQQMLVKAASYQPRERSYTEWS